MTSTNSDRKAPNTMRAVRYDRFGPAEVLYVGAVRLPAVADRCVRVQVHGASLSGGEHVVRAGKVSLVMGKRFPASVGVDFAGVVDAVGAGASGSFAPGDHVWGVMPYRTFGAMADVICVPAERLAKAPANTSLVEAAALPAVGTTVVRALSGEARLRRG